MLGHFRNLGAWKLYVDICPELLTYYSPTPSWFFTLELMQLALHLDFYILYGQMF